MNGIVKVDDGEIVGPESVQETEDTSLVPVTKLLEPSIHSTLGNGIEWTPVEPELNIEVTISFVAAATFSMSIFGKNVV